MLWWSASSPHAPVGGSTEAQWGKERRIEGVCRFKGHVGRLEVKGHLGVCMHLCERDSGCRNG